MTRQEKTSFNPHKLWKKLGLGGLLLLAGIVLSTGACTKTGSLTGGKKVFRIGNGDEYQAIDPHLATGFNENNVMIALLEGLTTPHPETLEPLPGVAESWEVSKDLKTYTFKIRAAAKWSNNDPMTADDFVYSWKRVLNPALGAEYAYMLHPIKNAEEFNKGKLKDFSKVGVVAKDKQTLVVTLKNPCPYFLSILMHYATFPVHRPTIEKFSAFEARDTKWTQPGNYVTNGPFHLTKWELNKVLVADKSPTYWNAGFVKLDSIEFVIAPLAQTEERMYRAGELDKTQTVPIHKIDSIKKERPKEFLNSPFLSVYLYKINTTRKHLKDPRVRRALSMAIDRQALVERVTKAGEAPAFMLTPPNTGGYTARAQLKFDLAEAKKLLAEAGYPDGKGLPNIEILYNTLESHRSIAEAIQQMWKVNLGISVTLKNQEWKVYTDSMQKLDYDVVRSGWVGDYPDPNTFLDLFLTGGGNNNTGWSNKKYDAIIKEANTLADQTKRLELFQQAEAIFVEEVPAIPLYFYTTKYLLSERVTGWYNNVIDWHPWQYVDIK